MNEGPTGADDPLRTHLPHSARVWNHLLGGKDNYPADRAAAEKVLAGNPRMLDQARADRAFLGRAVTHLVADQGVRQFLDIGTGLPSADNTHEVAQRLAPECRIVYVDHDPLVLVHARALLTSSAEGRCDYLDADLHDPGDVLRQAAALLDFSAPIAVMLVGVLHHIEGDSHAVVERLKDAVPAGSWLAVNHPTSAIYGETAERSAREWNESGGRPPVVLRSPREIARYFDGWELAEPGVVSCSRWRPAPGLAEPAEVDAFAGLARKP
ncbi:SAM-dependent methyltransferase [Actinomadura parmotrematis]|uniref:SAM-dependent methyltransferase n=1 Tax=Actinomadura parmotrematis TaxID=2864039 RepID=A0ABS7G4J7_9ACTN|nr:SAM-dependent methyltransferase [Actinomadura parmotrematis]MBW8487656.1 SAM-dependent methyltransferase [Actinomadura parmotrematis]